MFGRSMHNFKISMDDSCNLIVILEHTFFNRKTNSTILSLIAIACVHKPRELVKLPVLDFIASDVSICLEIRTLNFCFHPFLSEKN